MERSVTEFIKEYAKFHEAISKEVVPATIVFADLTGSTSYKLLKQPAEAQLKIYNHNGMVTDIVETHQGGVIKYLGDGVMAKFDGKESKVKAIEVAIQIQKAFQKYNEKLPDLDKIKSKIGINSGDVFLWEFKGHIPLDPQGTTVDIASRICDLAKPGQILCSADCKDACSGKPNIKFGSPVERELKGLRDKISICEVIWLDELGINETVHISPPSDKIRNLLSKAMVAEERGDYPVAVTLYERILEEDPQHFIANYKLGRIKYLHKKKLLPSSSRLRQEFELEDILKFAEQAKQSNPWSPAARLLYVVILWDIHQENLSNELLESFINDTEIAVELSKQELNTHIELRIKNSLAYFYTERYQRKKNEDLKKAIELCEYVDREYNWIYVNQQAAFFDTYSVALMKTKKPENLKKALNLLQMAIEIRPMHPLQYQHKAKLLKTADELGILFEEEEKRN